MRWITIKNTHINLDQIIGFKWDKDDQSLYLCDNTTEAYIFNDPDRKWYRKLCNACCMNMVEEE